MNIPAHFGDMDVPTLGCLKKGNFWHWTFWHGDEIALDILALKMIQYVSFWTPWKFRHILVTWMFQHWDV